MEKIGQTSHTYLHPRHCHLKETERVSKSRQANYVTYVESKMFMLKMRRYQ